MAGTTENDFIEVTKAVINEVIIPMMEKRIKEEVEYKVNEQSFRLQRIIEEYLHEKVKYQVETMVNELVKSMVEVNIKVKEMK